jgi:hypothetical protein
MVQGFGFSMKIRGFTAGFKISAHDRLVRFVGGPGAGRARAGPVGRAQNAQV